MSVNNTKFIMWGVEIQYPHYYSIIGDDDDKYESLDLMYRNEGKVGFISDGMSGQYAVAGKILAIYEEDGRDPLPEGVCKLSDIMKASISEDDKKEILKRLEEILGYQPKCDYLFINHYS